MEAEIANRFSDRRSMASAAELTGGPLGHRSRDLEREKVQREVERRMEREGRLALTRSTLNVSGLTLETRWTLDAWVRIPLLSLRSEEAHNLY
jgi:hypothetical protein